MSNLSRVNWTAQQRVDTHHVLAMESYNAFDLRMLVSSMSGIDRSYIIRGFEVVGKTGLTAEITIADSLVFNPNDSNGSFYAGLSDDTSLFVDLPANQTSVFVEATFINASQAPVNQAYWDAMALTGAEAGGKEFSASANTQNILVLVITANTVGFTDGAIPLFRASTTASTISSMVDSRYMLYRLATGGANPDSLHRYEFSSFRAEPPASGPGVGQAVDSSFRSRDAAGAINDKALTSLKTWADMVMTRISEVDGSPLWYAGASGLFGISLSQLFFDALGHSLQPSKNSAFKWVDDSGDLKLVGEGSTGSIETGLIKWKSNYSVVDWQLGGTFVGGGAAFRNYSEVKFTSPAPVDGGNVYLRLEREVVKGSGNAVSWADNGTVGSFVASKSIFGNAGDFTGIAIGDYVRKQSETNMEYYRVAKLSDGGAAVTAANAVADGTIIAIELHADIVSGASLEALRYFRSRYSDDDLFADSVSDEHDYQHTDYYWLGRRDGDLFFLKDYGTMQEGEEVTTLDAVWAHGRQGGGNLRLEHKLGAEYDATNGYQHKSAVPTTEMLKIRRLMSDNTVDSPSAGDNSGALLEYSLESAVGLMTAGQQLWVRLSDTTGGTLSSGSVTNTTDDEDNTDTTTNVWEIRDAADTPPRTFDNKNVYLLAYRVDMNGDACLLFRDGSILSDNGNYMPNDFEIFGEFKLAGFPATGALFIDNAGELVTTDVAEYFYDESGGEFGVRNFRITDQVIDQDAADDVAFLPTLANKTLTIGHASSTTLIPGDLIVDGTTVSANVENIMSDDKLISLGVGNLLDGGYGSGIEVADDTRTATQVDSVNTQIYVDITYGAVHGYTTGDIVGVSATEDVGGITAGQISGQYEVKASGAVAGDAEVISTTVLRVWTIGTATSTATASATPPRSFVAPWSIRLSDAAAAYSGITSWAFRVKGATTAPTITPVNDYGIVPTAHSVNMQAQRIPFTNDDNNGPNDDSTLNFTSDLIWDDSSKFLKIGGDVLPLTTDVHDIGSTSLRWQKLWIGEGLSTAGFGIEIGDVIIEGLPQTAVPVPNGSADRLLRINGSVSINQTLYLDRWAEFDATPGPGLAYVPQADNINAFASGGRMYQQDENGLVTAMGNFPLTNYKEAVGVVASGASGNNQMNQILTGSLPAVVTLPEHSRTFVGNTDNISAAGCANASSTVRVNMPAADSFVSVSDTVTMDIKTGFGGLTPAELSGTRTVTAATSTYFEYTAGNTATSNDSGPVDLVLVLAALSYRVGMAELVVTLNGQIMSEGSDYNEVNDSGSADFNVLSTKVEWNRQLLPTDEIVYYIKKMDTVRL